MTARHRVFQLRNALASHQRHHRGGSYDLLSFSQLLVSLPSYLYLSINSRDISILWHCKRHQRSNSARRRL